VNNWLNIPGQKYSGGCLHLMTLVKPGADIYQRFA
jgi:hypothetical protein